LRPQGPASPRQVASSDHTHEVVWGGNATEVASSFTNAGRILLCIGAFAVLCPIKNVRLVPRQCLYTSRAVSVRLLVAGCRERPNRRQVDENFRGSACLPDALKSRVAWLRTSPNSLQTSTLRSSSHPLFLRASTTRSGQSDRNFGVLS
jgi:hypothetical protein